MRTHRFLSEPDEILSDLTLKLSDSSEITSFRIPVGNCDRKLIRSDVLNPNIDPNSDRTAEI